MSNGGGSRLRVNLGTLLDELTGLFFHALLQGLLLGDALLGGVFADVFGDLHRAEVRTAHGTEVRGLCAFLWERLVVELARGDGVEAEVELIFPAEFEARLAQRVVAVLSAGMAFGEVGGVRGDLVGDDAVFHVFLVRQAEVFLGRDVAEHRAAIPTNHRRADAAGDGRLIAKNNMTFERAVPGSIDKKSESANDTASAASPTTINT